MTLSKYFVALGIACGAPGIAAQAAPLRVAPVAPVVPRGATTFDLNAVRLLDGPFKRAMETDRAYILRLDPDRLMSHMRKNAGLTPKAEGYGGWDAGGSGMIGHYLSACSLMSEATGDAEIRRRVDYIVAQMAEFQKASGQGGLYGFEWDAREWFPKLAQGEVVKVNVNSWYGTHKTLAGLRDAYRHGGNAQAREVLIRLADWCVQVTAKLSDEQWQQMLQAEHGGPHEIFADVYALTGDRKYLQLAEKFVHRHVFEPLARGDGAVLHGLHANTQVPKFIGYERIAELGGNARGHDAALNFWQNVVAHHTWANGGNSQWETFFNPQQFPDKVQDIYGPETCNTYNMLKLTRGLYTVAPSVGYVDYYERALYNHILASQAPQGGFNYYTSMRPGHYRVFSRDYDAFWCCVGTGMENHAKYGEMIYAQAPNRLFVNLFIASQLDWKAQNATVLQETSFPDQPSTRLTTKLRQPKNFTISVRYPSWVAPGALQVRVNGKRLKIAARPGSWADVTRRWKNGDRLEVDLPMRLRTELLPHSTNYAAILYGPILLAGALGSEDLKPQDYFGGGTPPIPGQLAQKSLPESTSPILVGSPGQILSGIVKTRGPKLRFATRGVARPGDVNLVPLYDLHFERYTIYWPLQTGAEYERKVQAERELARRTVDAVQIAQAASESAHGLQGERSRTGSWRVDRPWRDADNGGWFSFDLKVLSGVPQELRCTYWGSDIDNRSFDILVDGQLIATETLRAERPNEWFDRTYPLPPDLLAGKQKITVRFAAKAGNFAGGLFDCRILRRD